MQIKTTMRYHFISIRNAIYKKTEDKCWREYGEFRILVLWWEYKNGVATMENSYDSFSKVKVKA